MTATLPHTMPTTGTGQSGRRPVDRQALSTGLPGSAAKKSYGRAGLVQSASWVA
jgi:hypothetical protein